MLANKALVLVAHCKALEAHGPIASLNAGPPGPAVLLLALEGASIHSGDPATTGPTPTTLTGPGPPMVDQ